MRLLLATAALLLGTFTSAAPGACPGQLAAMPKRILRSGAVNPYYPCGASASSAASCPFRCYSATNTNGTTVTSLLPTCFSEAQAHTMSASLAYICVACLAPTAPVTNDTAASCTPLDAYINGTLAPARCGSPAQPLPACAWDCGAAQVPFSLCDTANTTGQFRQCDKCVPQCASPVLAFAGQGDGSEVTAVDVGFDVGNGNCSSGATGLGKQENVACPWRCKPAGSPYAQCRLEDVSAVEFATVCTRCG